MDDQGNAQEVRCPNYFKEPMVFFYRHYCDICPVQRPINLIISGQERLFHPFAAFSRSIEV